MATTASGMVTFSSFSLPSQLRRSVVNGRRVLLICSPPWLVPGTVKRFLVKASSSTAFAEPIFDENMLENLGNVFACPICYEPLVSNDDSGVSLNPATASYLQCKTCRKAYFGNGTNVDLTISTSGKAYGEAKPASTEIFRLPLVSFLYERGWRQSFSVWGGFPGPEKEFELIKDYLSPALGGKIVDASCGSGLFSRLFAKSGLFSLVVALDFSEAMLQQCSEFIKQEKDFPKENIILVRADIHRLPFASGSIDAVHAGAALHCWPSPSAAVAEISRVLRPGGIFVATTYILDGPFAFIPLLGTIRQAFACVLCIPPKRPHSAFHFKLYLDAIEPYQNFAQISGSHVFLSNRELEDLCTACGLVDFKFTRNRRFVMISARKPN